MPTHVLQNGVWRQTRNSKQDFVLVNGAFRPLVNKFVLTNGAFKPIYVNGVTNQHVMAANGSLDDYSGIDIDFQNGLARCFVDKDRRSAWYDLTAINPRETWSNPIKGYGQNNYWQRLYTGWRYFKGLHFPDIKYANSASIRVTGWGRSYKRITQHPSAANGWIGSVFINDPQDSSSSVGVDIFLTFS